MVAHQSEVNMVEIFQTILQYPLQFLAGLGISGGAIYGAFSFSKWLISLFTKKSQKAKEILNRQAIADTIINAVGGIDNFIDKIAEKVIEKFTTNKTIDEFKQVLQKISSKNDCPIELKAYIETVLSQSGSEQLSLLYEQTKATLIEMAKEKTLSVIDDGEKALEDGNVTPETKTIEQAQTIVEQDIKEETKPKPEKDEDIDYV
jgi:hypothetical protein